MRRTTRKIDYAIHQLIRHIIQDAKNVTAKAPPELREGLVFKLSVPIFTGIYFLCLKDRVIYVGQSINIVNRVHDHYQDKKFDAVYWIPVDKHALNRVEKYWIDRLKPTLNKMGC